jgi:hypothetical protein
MWLSLLQTSINIDLAGQASDQKLTGTEYVNFGGFLSLILTLVLTVAGLLLLFYLIWGAINWMSAGGDNSKVSKARDQITQAIIGLVVLLSTLAIFNLLQTFFGFEILTYSTLTRARQAAQQTQGRSAASQVDTQQLETLGNEALQSDEGQNMVEQGRNLLNSFLN